MKESTPIRSLFFATDRVDLPVEYALEILESTLCSLSIELSLKYCAIMNP